MKKLYAIVLGAALMLAGTQAYAQLSVAAGWLNDTERFTARDNNGTVYAQGKENLNGFYAGAQFGLGFGNGGFSVIPGLYLTMQFGKDASTGSIANNIITGSTATNYSELALNIPVNFQYAFEVGDIRIFAFLGPVFQFGLMSQTVETGTGTVKLPGVIDFSGSYKVVTNNYNGQSKSGDSVWEGDPSRKMFNMYIGGGAGFQAGRFMVTVGYDHSITNVSALSGTRLSRSQVKLGVGFAF